MKTETTPQQEYAQALVAAIGELTNVPKTANNPYFKSKYAPLDAIVDATRPVLAKHGLAIQQTPVYRDGCAGVKTIIKHKAGHYEESELLLPLKDQSPQGVGSAITYARRYSLAAVCGLATEEDDDGNVSSGLAKKEEPRPALAKIMDRNPSVRPAGNVTNTWSGVLPTNTKIAAKSPEGSSKKWVLYAIEFNDKGKVLETMTFDEKLYNLATELGKNGTIVDAGVCPSKKDPSKWEIVTITPNE
jgi:hypothetical protein